MSVADSRKRSQSERRSRQVMPARSGCYLLLGSVLLAAALIASPVRADSLAQMLYDVYDNNPDIQAEEAGQRARKADTRKAWSAVFPKVNAETSHSIVRTRLKQGGGTTTRTRTSQYGLSASQRLFSGFQNSNNIMKAKYHELSGQYQVRNRERQILLEAVKAYMDVYAARKMINLRRKHLANLEKQRRATLARIRAGELTRTDLSKTETLLYRARASLAGANADLGSAVARYEALAGYKPGELVFPQMPVRYLPKSAEDAEQKALQMHPDLRASRANIKASEYALKAAKGAFLPTLDANGEIHRNFASSHAETDKSEGSISLRLSLPIFDGGARIADVEKARAEHSQQKYSSHALAADIRADAHEQFLRNHAAQVALKQARGEVKAAGQLLRGIKIEEKAGQRSFLDILDAEVAYLDAQELEIYSRADSVIAIYSYLAATGQLTVAGARKAYVAHDADARAAVARAEQIARGAQRQQPKKAGTSHSKDPWSGLR